jgi:hypothetical protein
MKFTLTIELGNDAMQTLADVARSFADSVNRRSGTSDPLEDDDRGVLLDSNGNRVGMWTVSE